MTTSSSVQRSVSAPDAAPFGIRSIRIDSRAVCFDGKSFGAVGPYEILHGSIVADLDPGNPLNAGIVNLDKAPRNASGRVAYKVDLCILKPVDAAKANGWLFYEVL